MAPRTAASPTKATTRPRAGNQSSRGQGLRATKRSISNIPVAELQDHFDPDRPLTDKQRLFVKHWASGMSVHAATVAAGYSPSSNAMTYALTRHPTALALYHEEKRKNEEAANITRQDVMDMLKESFEMAKLLSEPATMVSAAREIGKMCGYYEPIKLQLRFDGSVQEQRKQMEAMTDEELLKMVAEGGPQAVQQRVEELKAEDNPDVTDVEPKRTTKRLPKP